VNCFATKLNRQITFVISVSWRPFIIDACAEDEDDERTDGRTDRRVALATNEMTVAVAARKVSL